MNPLTQFKRILILPILITLALFAFAAPASATLPPGNTVQQWNKIAEDTVVGSGAFQAEGYIYMAYTSAAVYDAVVAIQGGFSRTVHRSQRRLARRSIAQSSRPPTGRSSTTSLHRQSLLARSMPRRSRTSAVAPAMAGGARLSARQPRRTSSPYAPAMGG